MKNMKIRFPMYLLGLFIVTIGVAVSVKANLGVAPVSSIPYAMTCVWGIEMGKATIIFYIFLILLQALILRKKVKLATFLQLAIGIVFGYFTTFSNWCMTFLPDAESMFIRIPMMLLSVFLIALGLFFYIPANILPIPPDGTTQNIAMITGREFSKVKVIFDVSLVLGALVICLITIKSLGSVGIGTVVAAVMVGTTLGWINKFFGKWRDNLYK